MDALTHYIAIELAGELNRRLLDTIQADLSTMDGFPLGGDDNVLANSGEKFSH